MKKVCLLLIGMIILSSCSFGGLDTVRNSIPFLRSTPTATQPPTPSWTPSPVPSPTPVPRMFDVGQSVYIVPELVESVFGPFKLGRTIQYMHVSNLYCSDYDTYQLSEEWVYHGQVGLIESFITCGEEVYYRIAVEKWTYSDAEYLWVMENQLSEVLPVLNYPFVLSFSSDSQEDFSFSPYSAYLPEEQVVRRGQVGSTTINGHPVQITLNEVVQVLQGKYKYYRFIATGFMIQNVGNEPIEFNTKDLIQARANAMHVINYSTVRMAQDDPTDVKVLPGESTDFGIVWSFARTVQSDHLAIYLSVNTQIDDNLFVYVVENSLFFRDELHLND